MKRPSPHPDRSEMLRAIDDGEVPFRAHLEHCPVCRDLFALLRATCPASHRATVTPSADLVSRLKAIPLLESASAAETVISGQVEFDSWRDTAPVDLRDVTAGYSRYLVLRAGEISLELVGERTPDGWNFTARLCREDRPVAIGVLYSGQTKLLPRWRGFFEWSSARAPRTLRVDLADVAVSFERLVW